MSNADSQIGGAMQGMAAESGKSYGAVKSGGGGGDDGKGNDLYKINQVSFRMMPTLSLVAKRTLLVNQSQKTSYTGVNDTIIFNFNTGEYYVSCPTSYLYMQIGYRNQNYTVNPGFEQAKALIAQGNLLSLFEEVSFTTASGTEVCRELNKGLHSAFTYYYNNTQEYLDTIGANQGGHVGPYHMLHDGAAPVFGTLGGFGSTDLEQTFPTVGGSEGIVRPFSGSAAIATWGVGAINLNVHTINSGTSLESPTMDYLEFCVPLDQVLGLFKPYMQTLFPAGALAGGRLEIRLKNPTESLQFIDAAVESKAGTTGSAPLDRLVNARETGLTINKTYLVLDSFQLQDNVLVRLNQVSSGQDGLTVLYDTYDTVSTNFAGTGSVECQVQQARSRVVRSWCVVRDSAQLQNYYVNSLAAEAAVRRVAAKVGTRSPKQTLTPITTPDTNSTGIGGGLTYVMQKNVGTTITDPPTFGDGKTSSSQVLLQYQPPLPADPYYNQAQKTLTPSVSSYQAQLGALFFPQQPITTAAEHYQNALYVMCKSIPDKDVNCAVRKEDFYGGTGNNTLSGTPKKTPVDPSTNSAYQSWVAPYGLAIYGCLAEKSQMLQLSGLPISNARLLRHKLTFAYDCDSGTRQITTFTQFTRVMKVFLGGRVVVRE